MPSPEEMIQSILSDSDAMEKIGEMLSAFSGGGEEKEERVEESASPFDDPTFILKLTSLFGSMSGEEDNGTRLISALKPYLSEKRAESADKAIKLMKLSKITSLLGDIDIF